MKSLFQLIFVCLLILPSPGIADEKGLTVKGIRYFSYAAFTRIVFEVEEAAPYVFTRSADGQSVLFSSHEGPFTVKTTLPSVRDGVVNGIETSEDAGKFFIVIRLDRAAGEAKDFVLRGPDRIVIDVPKGAPAAVPQTGNRTTVIMLDPGHGGSDTGIVMMQGQEKSIVLELASAIKKILQKNQQLKVVMSRDRDAACTLDERAAAANAAGAKIFVSIHMAPGTNEHVYIEDPDEDVGMQKKLPLSKDFLGFETGSEQQEKIWGRQQASHSKDSGILGRTVARQFGKPGAEPLQAPLAELKAVDAAAILVEIGSEQNRRRAAESVAKGIEEYVRENR